MNDREGTKLELRQAKTLLMNLQIERRARILNNQSTEGYSEKLNAAREQVILLKDLLRDMPVYDQEPPEAGK